MARLGLANKILIVIVLLLALAAVVGFILIGTQGDAIDAILESSSSGQQQIEDQKDGIAATIQEAMETGASGSSTGGSTASTAAAAGLHPSIIGYWRFDEGSGQQVNDSSGNGHDGVRGHSDSSESNDPSWTSGKFESALDFDRSSDQFVRVPHSSELNPGEITMSAWVNPESYPDEHFHIIMAKENSYKLALGNNGGLWGAIHAGSGCDGGWCDDGGDGWIRSGESIPTGQWTHVAMAWDGTEFRFYVDGNKVHTENPPEASSGTMITGTNDDFGIGTRGIIDKFAGPRKFFHGQIDDVRLYGEGLSGDNITRNPPSDDGGDDGDGGDDVPDDPEPEPGDGDDDGGDGSGGSGGDGTGGSGGDDGDSGGSGGSGGDGSGGSGGGDDGSDSPDGPHVLIHFKPTSQTQNFEQRVENYKNGIETHTPFGAECPVDYQTPETGDESEADIVFTVTHQYHTGAAAQIQPSYVRDDDQAVGTIYAGLTQGGQAYNFGSGVQGVAASHEVMHEFRFCEEYSGDDWETNNNRIYNEVGGCINPWERPMYDAEDHSSQCSDQPIPADQRDTPPACGTPTTGDDYSVMGSPRLAISSDGILVPDERSQNQLPNEDWGPAKDWIEQHAGVTCE